MCAFNLFHYKERGKKKLFLVSAALFLIGWFIVEFSLHWISYVFFSSVFNLLAFGAAIKQRLHSLNSIGCVCVRVINFDINYFLIRTCAMIMSFMTVRIKNSIGNAACLHICRWRERERSSEMDRRRRWRQWSAARALWLNVKCTYRTANMNKIDSKNASTTI